MGEGCRLESLDASTTEARAARLLHGLGFTKTMQQKRTRDFSGGWRMRIALARALFVDPTFLILDGRLLALTHVEVFPLFLVGMYTVPFISLLLAESGRSTD